MEIGLREILILLGVLMIAGIFFDGYRRVRDNRRSHLGIRLDDSVHADLDDFDRSELPTGKARVVGQAREMNAPLRASLLSEQPQADTAYHLADAIETQASHPVSDEAADADDMSATEPTQQDKPADYLAIRRNSRSAQAAANHIHEKEEQETEVSQGSATDKAAPSAQAPTQDQSSADLPQVKEPAETSVKPKEVSAQSTGQANQENKARPAQSAKRSRPQEPRKPSVKRDRETEYPIQNKELIIVNIMAKKGDVFYGEKLMQTLLALGMRYGDMKIFHRYERPEEKKGLLFSMANLVEPGCFDLDDMSSFSTPGICLFLNLPGPKRSLYAFDLLIDTARKLVHNLGAEMRDESHSIMTSQTVEHYRQRVMEFERRQKMAKRMEAVPETY